MDAYLNNRLYVPIKYVSNYHLSKFTHLLPNPNCISCKDKKSDKCLECPFSESVEHTTYKRIKGYYAFCRGNLGKIYRVFNRFNIIDNTSKNRFKYDIKFNISLFPNQIDTAKTWNKYKYGIIKSPPRSGKTIICCKLICYLKYKTLILTHQAALLNQFLDKFNKFSNLDELRRIYKTKKIIGITNCREDITDYDIVLSTYQSFTTPGGIKCLDKIRNSFGLVVVDEAHLSGADCFRRVVDTLNSKVRLGLSATPVRKDGLECVVYDIMGPITSVGKSDEMKCKVVFHKTGCKVETFYRWQTYVRRLSKNIKRNNYICNMAKRDADNGRYILIVCDRRNHIDILYKKLKDKGLSVITFDGRVPKKLRSKILEEATNGKYNVFISMRKNMILGIDCPLWDIYYYVSPIAYAENYYQEMSRVRTPYTEDMVKQLGRNKPMPIIRVFLDYGHKSIYACLNIINSVHKKYNFVFVNSYKNEYKNKVKKLRW